MFDNLGGPIVQDAFAHPVGTEYATNSDGTYQFDANGAPIEDLIFSPTADESA